MTQRQRWTDQQFFAGFLVVIALAAITLVWFATTAAAAVEVLFDIPSATRIDNGKHQLSFTFPTGHAGETCRIALHETNEAQPSAHPGNRLVLDSGAVHIEMLIERERGGFNDDDATGVVGKDVTVTWVLGDENVSSSGASATIECEAPPSTTTSSPPDSTVPSTLPPDTTVTSVPTDTTTSSSTSTTVLPTTTTSSSIPTLTSVPSSIPTTTVPLVIPSGVPTGEGPTNE